MIFAQWCGSHLPVFVGLVCVGVVGLVRFIGNVL